MIDMRVRHDEGMQFQVVIPQVIRKQTTKEVVVTPMVTAPGIYEPRTPVWEYDERGLSVPYVEHAHFKVRIAELLLPQFVP